jgi:uncharacterized protein YaaQ
MRKLLIAIIVIGLLGSCSPSTEIVKVWQAPGVTVTANKSNKTLIIAVVKDEKSREIIENRLIKKLKSTAVASYTLISEDSLKKGDTAMLIKKLKEGQFNYVLLMRLNNVKSETVDVVSTPTQNTDLPLSDNFSVAFYYGGYDSYYGYTTGYYAAPDYYSKTRNYFVETNVYSVNPNKLIWTSTTKTVNPSKLDRSISSIADEVINAMYNNQFLK